MKDVLRQVWERVRIFFPKDKERFKILFLCFFIAMIIWLFRAFNKEYTTDLQYPIQFTYNNPDSFCVINKLPETIELELKGGGWNLLSEAVTINPNPIPIHLEHPERRKKIYVSSLRSVLKNYFHNLDYISASPDSFTIDIERKISKKVKIFVDPASIDLNEPFHLSKPLRIEPDSAVFTGPESYINSISDSVEIALKSGKISQSITEKVPIIPFDSKLISVSPENVFVRVEVKKVIRITNRYYVKQQGFPSNLTLSDSISWVTIYIDENKINNLSSDENFIVEADFRKMRKDSTILPELTRYPDYVDSIVLDTLPLHVIPKRK